MTRLVECESCAENGTHGVPATGHSTNPEWSGYNLCDECQAEYNGRDPVNQAQKPLCPDCLAKGQRIEMGKSGHVWSGRVQVQRWRCAKCGRTQMVRPA